MIDRQAEAGGGDRTQLALFDKWPLDDPSDGQDGGLRRIEDGIKGIDA